VRPKLKDLLVRHRPKEKAGGDRQSDKAKSIVDNINNGQPAVVRKTGTSRLYIEERLQRLASGRTDDVASGVSDIRAVVATTETGSKVAFRVNCAFPSMCV
jgi:hypothetical protein